MIIILVIVDVDGFVKFYSAYEKKFPVPRSQTHIFLKIVLFCVVCEEKRVSIKLEP